MKNIENILLIGVLIIAVGILIFSLTGFSKSDSGITSNVVISNNVVNSVQKSETKTSDSTVIVDLTPAGFKDGKFYIDIGVNTHTVGLDDYDLKEMITLEFEDKILSPVSAPVLSGHHNSGTLVFDTGKEIKNFKVIVKGLPEISERMFEWP